ncbi:LamG-like jellyroll fold domain-containing protein [Streptomyces sp. NPDC055966]|uniref:LamG-like jellyroll fold domain-containing protein n=1 Tax=Streptomyces sp. NPDC055966 TaxID=3345669 RepID=UPI0035DA97C0
MEVPGDRTANTSVFRNADGTLTARVYSRAVHYRAADGTWADIDTTLKQGPDGRWAERADAPSASFATSGDDPQLVSYGPNASERVTYGLQGAASAAAQASGNTVTYPNIATSSDLTYAATSSGVKETLLLHDASAPTTWVFPLHLTGLTPRVAANGNVEFTDAHGAVKETIPHGYMEDANRGKVSGEGAISTGVTYSLTTASDGTPALRVSLDAAWLHDSSRAFPVKVDPTSLNASSSTYVETPYDINFSTDSVLKVGSYDGGTHSANSYLLFWSAGSTFQNDYIEKASLYLDDVWSGGCTAEPVNVHAITSSWGVSQIADYPGLSYGSTIGTSSFEAGASCGGSSWHGIDIGDNPSAAGVKLIEGWAHGGNNLGLALDADTSQVAAWKQFASVNSSYPPYLSVTYSTYGADYSLPSQTYTPPTANTNGSMQVKVTNRGTTAWTTSNMTLSTDMYTTSWSQIQGANSPRIAVPSTVNPNSSVTMTGSIGSIAPGQYYVCWDMYLNGNTSFYFTYGVPTTCAEITSVDTPPQIDSTQPPSNAVLGSLTPELFAGGHDPDNYPGKGLTYDFKVYSNPTPGSPSLVVDSGSISATHWVVPSGKLAWNQPYYWVVSNNDTLSSSAWSYPSYFSTTVPQPLVTSHLGAAALSASGRAFDPQVGDYTTGATDASVSVVGPKLAITRSYNSLDSRTTTLFGAGWSTPYDVFAVPDGDGSGAVVVTEADGHAVRFGLNADGTTYAPPQGTYATFASISGGGYTLTDKTGTLYTLGRQVGSAWKLTKVTDRDGRSETLTYNADGTLATVTNTASNRSLHFAWGGGHVNQVATDAVTSGGAAETWTYSYSGDQLTGVCPPTSSTACTAYAYTSGSASGSHYRSSVLDANPSSYWRLGEPSGTTTAASEIGVNEGNDNGTYTGGVTPGSAGFLPGSPTTSASFNGTSGYVALPNSLLTSASYAAVGMWFKTTGSGVLFSYQADALSKTSTPGSYTPALYVGTSGKLYGELWNNSVAPMATSASVADGKWHYAALSAAGTTQSLYLDGALVGTLSGQVQVSGQPVDAIGAGFLGGSWPDQPHYSTSNNTGYPTYFSGQIAEAAFYTHALGLPAIQQQYAAGTHAASELTGITLPSGKTRLQAAYDAVHDRASQITDAVGGTWKLGMPATTGSGAYYRDAVVNSAPPNYWRLSDSSGTQAANEVPGTTASNWWSSGAATYNNVTLGKPGLFTGGTETSAGFNGTSSYLSLPSTTVYSGKVTANFSIGLWFKTSTGGETLFSYQSGAIGSTLSANYTPALYIGSDGYLYGQWWDGHLSPMQSSATVNDGQWHQVVLTANTSGKQTLSLDGQQADTRTGSQLDFTGEPYVSIGAGYISGSWPALPSNNAQGYFNGSIAEVATFNRALDATTIANQYAARGAATGATPVTTASVTDPGSKTLTYRYDPGNSGRLVSTTNALGYTTSYGYDTGGFVSNLTDPDGNFTATTHNTRGDVLSSTNSDMHGDSTTSYATYPATGTYAATDPRNDEATSTADGRSSGPTDTTYATTHTYSTAGDPLTTTDPDGHVTTSTYTAGTESAIGGGTEPAGLRATSKDPRGETTTYAYDSAGDLAQVTSPSGLKTSYTYDNLGHRLTQTEVSDTYPAGVTSSYTYDGQDRLITRTGPATTDAVAGTTHTPQITYAYDADGNTTSQAVADTTGGDATRTSSWTYNSYDQLASATDPANRATSYGYDAYGNRTTQNSPDGTAYAYAYSPTGELLTSTLTNFTGDPVNPTSPTSLVVDSRAYDPSGLLASDTDSMGRTTGYYYNWNHQLIESYLSNFHKPDGSTTTKILHAYAHDGAGNLTEQQDTNAGVETDYTVDPAGLTTASTFDPYGLHRTASYSYDADGNLTSQSQTGGGVTEQTDYAYDAIGDQTSKTVHNGSTNLITTSTYDERGYLTSTTDPRGNVTGANAAAYSTSYLHDPAGQLTQITAPVVNAEANGGASQQVHPITLYGYNTFGDKTSADNPDGNITTYTFDKDSEQIAASAPAYTPPGSTTSITPTTTAAYDANGRITGSTDGLGNTTNFTYDQLGDLAQTVQPAVGGTSPTTHNTYDTDGDRLSVTDPTGAASDATYDDLGRILTVSDVVRQPSTTTNTTSFGYDEANNTTSVTMPGGQQSNATYDAAGDRLTTTDPLSHTTTYSYNLDGQVTKTALPDNTATTYSYDLARRLTATTSLDNSGKTLATSAYAYDPAGNATSVTNADSNTTTYAYDASNNLVQQTEPVSASATITTGFGHDAAGLPTRYTDGNNNATITTYNPLGAPESTIEPSTSDFPNASDRTTTIAYDADGHPVTLTRPGNVTQTSTYDADGRLTGQTGSGAEATTTARSFGYDTDGRLTSASAPNGTNTYTYDDRGKLLSAAGPSGSASYTYNANGQTSSRTDKGGTAAYTYDAAGRLATASDPLTGAVLTYTRNTVGQVTNIAYGSSGTASQALSYDAQHRLTGQTLTAPGGASEASTAYGYDPVGHITSQTTTGTAGAASSTYGYDQAGRLTSATNGSTTTSYGYDAASNRTSTSTGTTTTNATYNARDRLTATTGAATTSYVYTARGTLASVTNGSTENLTHDAFDQLANDGTTAYTHDSLGRLATAGAGTFTYNGTDNAIVADGTETYGRTPDGQLISVSGGSGATLAYTNQHGDLTATFTATGTTLAGSTAYDAFGKTTASAGTQHHLGYQGGWTDPGTHRVATASRWYDPGTGNFTSHDASAQAPIPSPAGNPYAYGNADPLANTDPSGNNACSTGGGGGDGSGYSYTSDYSPDYSSPYDYNEFYWQNIANGWNPATSDPNNPGQMDDSSSSSGYQYDPANGYISEFNNTYGHSDGYSGNSWVSEGGSGILGGLGTYYGGGALGDWLGGLAAGALFAGYGSCDTVGQAPPPPPPPTAQMGLRENPGPAPTGQATGPGTHAEVGTKTAATGPSDTAPVHLHGKLPAHGAYRPTTNAGKANMVAVNPSGGLGSTLPIDPNAGSGNTLINPVDLGAGAGLTSILPADPDAGVGSTLINPIDPGASKGWSSLFPVDPTAGLPSVALALPPGAETRYIYGGSEEGAAQLSTRATDLQNQAGWSGTTSVVRVRSKADPGREMTLVSSNKQYMPTGWKTLNSLLPGETYVQLPGHAEQSILQALSAGAGWEIVEGGTSTGVCWGRCFPSLTSMGVTVDGPVNKSQKQNSPWRTFWTTYP